MHAWTAPELARFLNWAGEHDSDIAMAWRLLACTGMRRGEALALRWRDVDLDAARVAVRRSVGVVKDKGQGEQLVEGVTTTGQSRVVDLDAGTIAALRAYRAVRGSVALVLVRDTALVLGTLDGRHRHPERFSRQFVDHVRQARKAVGEELLPVIRLHDLRTPTRRRCWRPVSRSRSSPSGWAMPARPSPAPSTRTRTPGMGRQAVEGFAALLGG
jgi:integrase